MLLEFTPETWYKWNEKLKVNQCKKMSETVPNTDDAKKTTIVVTFYPLSRRNSNRRIVI